MDVSKFHDSIECFRDLRIPDEMLKSFFSQFPLAYLLKNQNDFDKKKFVKIKYQGLTYIGSIDNYITLLSQETSHRQLTIKLSHDGFKYSKRKYFKAKVCTHDMGNWYVLGGEILNEMPFLQKLKRESDSILVFYYNIKYARIDIKFFKNDENEEPFMLITFESGNPVTPPETRFRF